MSSPVAATTDTADGYSGVLPSHPGVTFAIVAAVGSLVAWFKWYPAEGAPTSQSIRQSISQEIASGKIPSGSLSGIGLSLSHGFGTAQGAIGLCAAIALVIAVALFDTRSKRVLGARVLLLAAVVLLVDGIVTVNAAITAYNSWKNLPFNGSLLSDISNSVASAIAHNSLLPAFGAAAAGAVALIGAFRGIGGVRQSRRLDSARAPLQLAPRAAPTPTPSRWPAWQAVSVPVTPDCSGLHQTSTTRRCRVCDEPVPTEAKFCGACGAAM